MESPLPKKTLFSEIAGVLDIELLVDKFHIWFPSVALRTKKFPSQSPTYNMFSEIEGE